MKPARSKIALLAAAALTVALIAVIAWQWSASASPTMLTAARPNANAPAVHEPVARQELAPLPAPIESPRSELPAMLDTTRVAVESADVDKAHVATVVLKGTIDSVRKDLQLAQITVQPSLLLQFGKDVGRDLSPAVVRRANADGTFELDVTELIQTFGAFGDAYENRDAGRATPVPARKPREEVPTFGGASLALVVTHPKLATTTESVPVDSDILERMQRERRIELTTVVHMRQSTVTLLGQAWTVDGVAAKIQIAALKSAVVIPGDRHDLGTDVHMDNSFTLEVDAPANYAIIAIADGYRPCTLHVSVAPDNDVTLPPLILDHGQTIRGRVRSDSKTSIAGATIAAQPSGSFTRVQLAGKGLACFEGTFEWATRSAKVDANGEYEVSGLGPRAYLVSTSSVPGAYLGRVTAREFVAPCAGADLTLGGVCEVHVTFNGATQPSATRFGVRQQHGAGGTSFGAQESASNGQVTLFIEPGATTSIVVPGSDGERVFAVPACSAGRVVELRIDL